MVVEGDEAKEEESLGGRAEGRKGGWHEYGELAAFSQPSGD